MKYIGQKTLSKLYPIINACCKLEGEMIENLELKNNKKPNAYWEAIKKIYKSDFIVWLNKQESYKESKRTLIDNHIILSLKENDFFASFDHFILNFLQYIAYMGYTPNASSLVLKKRKAELKKNLEKFNNIIRKIYPTLYIPDEFIRAKSKIEEEIKNASNYINRPELLRTLMADNFLSMLVNFYKRKLNILTPTILTDITLNIMRMLFNSEINREYLMKKASIILSDKSGDIR